MKEKIKAGIIGGAGFAAGELIRLLLHHPNVHIEFVQSNSQHGKKVAYLHPDLDGECNLTFTRDWSANVDILFFCRSHGQTRAFFDDYNVAKNIKVIDLSQDFRTKENSKAFDREFIYGLPELNREKIRTANSIANPGCFATSIELSLLPLASSLNEDVHIHSITGATGAGQNLSVTSLFSWRDNNISTYKVFEHQHLSEIRETLQSVDPSFNAQLFMVPVRGNYPRGIFTTLYAKTQLEGEEIRERFRKYYADHPFIRLNGSNVYLKKAVNTNNVFISIRKHQNVLFIESVIDNLIKGASGQAVQNMNIMFGLEETTGLKMKASAY